MGPKAIFSVIGVIWAFTLFRSLLIMICGKSIFKKASKNEITAFYPIINLFTMLEICDISTFFGILLFIPGLNLIVLFMMSYKLGEVFNTSLGFKIGLVVFPLMFYLLLSIGNKQYKLSDEAYFKAMDRIKDKDINLMTDEEIRKASEALPQEDKEEVDSIFKSNIQMMEQVETYKAAKIDLLGLEKLKNHTSDDDPTLRDLGFAPNPPKRTEEVKEEVKEEPKEEKKEEKPEEKKSEFETVDL